MKKTLQSKLLFWFLCFSFITFASTIGFNAFYFKKKANISTLTGEITELHVQILKTFNSLDEFFAVETNNISYFETGQSQYLDSYREGLKYIYGESERLSEESRAYNLDISSNLQIIQDELQEFDAITGQMLKLISSRGFKNYGLEGEMRDFVHILENFNELDQERVLSLRRHEKDYIIRNQEEYVEKLNELGKTVQDEVRNSRDLKSWEKDSIINIVSNYMALFNRIVKLDREIGIKDNSQGYMNRLNTMSNNIEKEFTLLIEEANMHKDSIFKQMELFFILFFAILVVGSLYLSWRISRKVTAPLQNLTVYIGKLIKSRFKRVENFEVDNSHYEIEVLNAEFLQMIDLLNDREVQRDLATKAMQESELKYRELADLLPLSVYETDLEGKLTYVNKSWIQQFGYQLDEVNRGLYLKDMFQTDWDQIIQDKPEHGREYVVLRKDRSSFPGLVYTDRIIKDQLLLGLRGIVVDIEDRKKYIEELKRERSKAKESDRLKSAFLANMSHEIRTPMNAILGFSELLGKLDAGSAKREEFIKQIKTSGNLLLNLIDEIIDIAKIEAGEIKIKIDYTPINQICEELVLTFRELIRKDGKIAHLDIQFQPGMADAGFAILTDPFRLKQVLSNLIGNAIKFTEKGLVDFGYQVHDGELIFFVKDTGIGIPSENVSMIFDRFRQVDDEHTRTYGGTGLGLAISKNLVELLEGQIWVKSEQFKGTTFFFSVPKRLPVQDKQLSSDQNDQSIDTFNWAECRLLIAEDDEANAHFLREALSPAGVKIDHVLNGKEAVDYCLEGIPPDLILMDIRMPVMNGLIASEKIKAHLPGLPIIAQTAYALADEKEACFEAGCDDYIAKPTRIDELRKKIFNLLSKSTVIAQRV